MSEKIVAKLRSGFITDACGIPLRGSTEKIMDEAADLLEQQAKELAEAQARVVVALDQLKLDLMLENERMPTMTKRALDKFEQALAFTDTAVQELRQKYIEPTSCGRCDYDEAEGGLIEQCPKCKAIDAAKEKP